MALEIDVKNTATTGNADATGKAIAKENKNNNVPATGEKNLVNGSSAATKKKGALTTFSIYPLPFLYPSNKNKGHQLSLCSEWPSAILAKKKLNHITFLRYVMYFFYNALNAAAARRLLLGAIVVAPSKQ